MNKTKENMRTNRLGKAITSISVISLGVALIVSIGLIGTVSAVELPVCQHGPHPNGGPFTSENEGYWIDMDTSTPATKVSSSPQAYTGVEDSIIVQPGETVQVKAIVDFRGYTACPYCVMYQRVFASWEPDTVLADLYTGQLPASLNYMEKTITFTAPTEAGEYKLHHNWRADYVPPPQYCDHNMVETTLIVELANMDIQAEIRNIWTSDTMSPIVLFGQDANLGQVVQADLDADSFSDSLPNWDSRCLGPKNYDKSIVSRFREGDNKVRIVVDITGGTGFNPGSEGYIRIINPDYKITKIFGPSDSDYIGTHPPTNDMHTLYSGFGVIIDAEGGIISWQGRGGCPACGCRENFLPMEFLVEKPSKNFVAPDIEKPPEKTIPGFGALGAMFAVFVVFLLRRRRT